MKLQVTIGKDFTMNTTPQGLGNCFDREDAELLKDMLNLSAVLHLEGEADAPGVGFQASQLLRGRPAGTQGTQPDTGIDQGSGLEPVHAGKFVFILGGTGGINIDTLPCHHALPAGGMRKRADHRGNILGLAGWLAEHFKRQ